MIIHQNKLSVVFEFEIPKKSKYCFLWMRKRLKAFGFRDFAPWGLPDPMAETRCQMNLEILTALIVLNGFCKQSSLAAIV